MEGVQLVIAICEEINNMFICCLSKSPIIWIMEIKNKSPKTYHRGLGEPDSKKGDNEHE